MCVTELRICVCVGACICTCMCMCTGGASSPLPLKIIIRYWEQTITWYTNNNKQCILFLPTTPPITPELPFLPRNDLCINHRPPREPSRACDRRGCHQVLWQGTLSMLLDVRSSEADPIWTVHPTVSSEGSSWDIHPQQSSPLDWFW